MPSEQDQHPQADTRAYSLEWLGKQIVSSLFTPASDPTSAGHLNRNHLGTGTRVLYGRILDAVAYTHCYRVAFEKGHPPMVCTAVGPTGMTPIGARAITCYPPGTKVWVATHHQMNWGVILGAEPSFMTDPTLALSDFIHQASRCGLRTDKIHNAVFRLNKKGMVTDFSSGRPFDGTTANEWGAITETGIRVTVDSFMAQLAADEATGVWAFYHDQLLRLAGVNWQAFSSGHEEEWLQDQLEIHGYRGIAVYPWEQMGAFDQGTTTTREVDPAASQVDEPHYAALEPEDDRQKPFHRIVELSGYLGQGGKRVILVPPTGGLSKYGEKAAIAAVLEEQRTLSGRYSIRSSKGLSFEKRISIPAPQRIRRAEDPQGDTQEDYRFSGVEGLGVEGSGPPHKVKGELESTADRPHLQQAAAAADVGAYVHNWEGAHPLHYHKKDWALEQESETPFATNEQPIPFADLASKAYLDRPEPIPFRVDDRYGDVQYFPNRSYFTLLDDGGIVIGDGYGAEIRMVGGRVSITSPGDVDILPGRNLNVLAGYDAILRSKHSVDVSCAERDVRIKAERNLHMLAGNAEAGGILIESKSPSRYEYSGKQGEDVTSGGVQIKAAKGDCVTWARNIYLRTGGGDVEPGFITLDADHGNQQVIVHAQAVQRFIATAAVDHFGTEGNVEATNIWGAQGNLTAAGIQMMGNCLIDGGIIVNGWINCAAGHIATELAAQYNYLVPVLAGLPLAQVQDGIDESQEQEESVKVSGETAYREIFENYWYAEEGAGEDATIEAVHFSFRSEAQYRTDNFELWEARWQQLARLAGGAPATWTEPEVEAGSVKTMPYPGREKWKGEDCLVEQGLDLYNVEEGISKDRDDPAYETPKFREPERKTCDGYYAVII